jgi:hypothetical protein
MFKFGLMAVCPTTMNILQFCGYHQQPDYVTYCDFYRECINEDALTEIEFVVCPAPDSVVKEYGELIARGSTIFLTPETDGMSMQ